MPRILDIVSLGPGRPEQMTLEARDRLVDARAVYCRIRTRLLADFAKEHRKPVYSFGHLYRRKEFVRGSDRSLLYATIAGVVVDEAERRDGVVYALPGSAVFMEATPFLIHKLASARAVLVRTTLGISFVDVVLDALPPEYRKHTYPQLSVTAANLDMPMDPQFNYLVAQTSDLLTRYGARKIRQILERRFSREYRFLLVRPDRAGRSQAKELRPKDLSRREVQAALRGEGTLFLPASTIDHERESEARHLSCT